MRFYISQFFPSLQMYISITMIKYLLLNELFPPGITGTVAIKPNGDRDADYSLYDFSGDQFHVSLPYLFTL